MSELKFSVLMSVYNKDNPLHFRDSVMSLLSQTLRPDQIVIVKDGPLSSDFDMIFNLFELEFSDIIDVVSLSENRGLAEALNFGFKFIKHDIIARMDSDDISIQERFEVQIRYLEDNKLDLIGGQMYEFLDSPSNIFSFRKVPTTHEDIVKFMKWRSPFNHPTIVFRRIVYETVRGYDQHIFPEDYLFFVKSYIAKFKFGNVSDFVLYFRLGAGQNDSFKRRLGLKYALSEIKLYREFRRLKFIGSKHLLILIMIKIPVRLFPLQLFKVVVRFSRLLKLLLLNNLIITVWHYLDKNYITY